MASNDYHFITHWRVKGTVHEVFTILSDPAGYARWWPEVFLEVQEDRGGMGPPLGRTAQLHTRGFLPYTLRWEARVAAAHPSRGFVVRARGDLVGRGAWSLRQESGQVSITYDWKVRARKPLLRWLSFLLRPIFVANHRWAMCRGEQRLQDELTRRAALVPRRARQEARVRAPSTFCGRRLIPAMSTPG